MVAWGPPHATKAILAVGQGHRRASTQQKHQYLLLGVRRNRRGTVRALQNHLKPSTGVRDSTLSETDSVKVAWAPGLGWQPSTMQLNWHVVRNGGGRDEDTSRAQLENNQSGRIRRELTWSYTDSPWNIHTSIFTRKYGYKSRLRAFDWLAQSGGWKGVWFICLWLVFSTFPACSLSCSSNTHSLTILFITTGANDAGSEKAK